MVFLILIQWISNLPTGAGVQYIITSVIDELRKDPKRKFIFVETSFFKMWWDHQDMETKNFVQLLVDEGRFEFISGGWSM